MLVEIAGVDVVVTLIVFVVGVTVVFIVVDSFDVLVAVNCDLKKLKNLKTG